MTTNVNTPETFVENPIVVEIDKAETLADLKAIVNKYPQFADVKGYKTYESLYEALMDAATAHEVIEEFDVEKNAEGVVQHDKPKSKGKKEKKAKTITAYGTALELMCKNPELSFPELKTQLKKKGFVKDSACRTAHVTVKKVVELLKANKHM